MKEKYLIGHVSEILKISKDTLRYYDKLGIVCPKKDAFNNYRYYTLEDMLTLSYVLVLRDLSIPLEQIKHFIQNSSLDDFNEILNHQELLINNKINHLLALKEKICNFKTSIVTVKTHYKKITQKFSPPFVYKILSKEWDSKYSDYLFQMEEHPNISYPAFSCLIPPTELLDPLPPFSPSTISPVPTYIISGIVKDMGLMDTLKGYCYIPPTLCLHIVLRTQEDFKIQDKPLIQDYIISHNVSISDVIMCRNIAFEHVNQISIEYYELWIPFSLKNNT